MLLLSGHPVKNTTQSQNQNQYRIHIFTMAGSGTFFSSVVTLSATAMGAGVLSLPIAFYYCGYVGGTLLLLLMALMSDYSLLLLVRAGRAANQHTIEGIGRAYYGRKGALLVKVSLLALLFGAMIILLIVVGDVMTPPFQYFALDGEYQKTCPADPAGLPGTNHAHAIRPSKCPDPMWWAGTWRCSDCSPPPWWAGRAAIVTTLMAAMFPLFLQRKLAALQYTSSAAVAAIIFVFCCLAARFPNKVGGSCEATAGGVSPTARPFNIGPSMMLAMPMMSLAFCCQFNILDLERELLPSLRTSIDSIVHVAILGTTFAIYAGFGLLGYLPRGDNVANCGDILNAFPMNDSLMLVCSLAIGICNVLKLPLATNPSRNVVNEILGWKAPGCGALSEPLVDCSEPAEPPSSPRETPDGRPSETRTLSEAEFTLETFVLIGSVLLASLFLQKLQLALSLLGCTAGVLVCFIIPGLFYDASLHWTRASEADCEVGTNAVFEKVARTPHWTERAWPLALIFAGFLIGVLSLTATVYIQITK